jgi:transketolase
MKKIDQLAINNLRVLAVEAINKAKSGHPGIALGAAPMIHTLYSRFIKFNPNDEKWINRDRFVLSAGHGSALLYAMLNVYGLIDTKDLQGFRQLNSITPGHPEVHLTKGVDVSSGPLGQGMAMAVGMALAESHLHAKFPKLIDHYTYVLCGDGDLQEGITQEAASLAGHLALEKLIVLYDSNDIQLDGPVALANNESTKDKFLAMNWNYDFVADGNDVEAISNAIEKAKKANKPTIIEVKTIIGYGAKNQGTHNVHGAPIPSEEVEAMRQAFGGEAFSINDEVKAFYQDIIKANLAFYNDWQKVKTENQDQLFLDMLNDDFKIDVNNLVKFDETYDKATRVSSGAVLKALNTIDPMLIGGSADLTSSTNIAGADGEFSKDNRLGRNIKFGVREHAMAAIANGIALHGMLKPFVSGFFVFSDYMKPAIRLSALMHLPVMYIFTHDSIAVGEDGPTHQPIEQLTMLRSIPNVNVIRPADANEVKEAYQIALDSKTTPTVIVLTRQNCPMVVKENESKVNRGAYILSDVEKPEGILIASGSEVNLALAAQALLKNEGKMVRVVSMPSTNLFDQQDEAYKNQVLPKYLTKRLAIEMGEAAHMYKYTGLFGCVYNINEFGKSGKGPEVIKDFGFTAEKIKESYLQLENTDVTIYIK